MVASVRWRRHLRLVLLCLGLGFLSSLRPSGSYLPRNGALSHLYQQRVRCVKLPGFPTAIAALGVTQHRTGRLSATNCDDSAPGNVPDHNGTSNAAGSTTEFGRQYLRHDPVLLQESVDLLVTNPDGKYLDVTLGYGGHAEAILQRLSSKGLLIALDRDPEAVYYTSRRLGAYVSSNQLVPVIGTFSSLRHALESHSLPLTGYTGVLADLGLSTHQLETPSRGFAYSSNGPLDMRMSNPLHDPFSSGGGRPSSLSACNTAFKVINSGREHEIARIFRDYGEEARAAMIARQIVEALRIYVNDELSELRAFLEFAPSLLHRKRGSLAVISYHSLEDRAVKRAFVSLQSASESSPDSSVFRILTKKCITPSASETHENQKSRSAKLRCLQRQMHAPAD
ncbi:16S rRNA (cytosine(1402)-N(4))-methyltransferase [Babesia caballi]|uniref:16S rRNA (Cytosine(1402)-N(4))-methyltransferase n=1 Tax=Babesia caballi TaxID=5871 RepID=A0AAV4M369_BABCB|nr:16S rRNA (cytosine(1402)-N(4))-methyltransferase [Babesia caballi]